MPLTPIVLVPGLNCTERAFVEVLPALWPFGSVTIANHRRGGTVTEIARGILAEAPERFALLGFSMGGYIAFEIFRQAPHRIERLCCLATSARPDTPEQTENRERQIALTESGKFASVAKAAFPLVVHSDNVGNERLRAIHLDMAAATGAETYVVQQKAIIARPDSRPMLAGIGCPTAVIVGETDQITGVEAAVEIANTVPGAKLTRVPGAGHLVPLEQPAAVQGALAHWMSL
ncbi:alpha/beta hydrolase [Devosia pacifica]|uniref:Alpha/beta hydrolase n=1 Tax=Devosia pacifica TaxID=1335967 RepID=A0A918VSQ5_9HYPH|nr:alpha/beta fold hydrolase [Devosia pacifica]GHA20897.1 alpha/beta hydrolase [Devosia pacifica]